MILGGGYVDYPNVTFFEKLSTGSQKRLLKGITIYHKLHKSKLVFSGYSRSNKTSLAYVISRASLGFGVNPKDTFQLRKPSNTLEEALDFKKRFYEEKFYLVTSAYHMPRAMRIFKSFGLKPKPIPTDFKLKEGFGHTCYVNWGMNYQKFKLIEFELHEYIGILFFPLQKGLNQKYRI
ncbi:YdcF family protein [Flavobacterium aciduliphilum]|uniref:DUF218 domain-containing protein n=1 Tax=Flavobacterium aciduliphilum TaxID=1101402 RepID=A0A328YAN1_9FLAO|nr:YdcF family protein [Flavobacterium aciduliphilum]RAR70233.1 DUF218 domain-containing protein [Flavobacterium aciduliphilum]